MGRQDPDKFILANSTANHIDDPVRKSVIVRDGQFISVNQEKIDSRNKPSPFIPLPKRMIATNGEQENNSKS